MLAMQGPAEDGTRNQVFFYLIVASFLTLAGLRYSTEYVSVAALFTLTCYMFITTRRQSARTTLTGQVLALGLLIVLSLWAWTIGSMVTHTMGKAVALAHVGIALSALMLWLKSQTFSQAQLMKCLELILDGVAMYVVANVLSYFLLGLRQETVEFSAASSISWFDSRIYFPLAQGWSVPEVISGAYAAAYPFYRTAARDSHVVLRIFRLAAFFGAILIVIAAGGRVPAAVAILVFASVRWFPGLAIRSAAILACVSLLVPLWAPTFGFLITRPGSLVADLTPFFGSRGETVTGRSDIESFNSRAENWDSVLTHEEDAPVSRLIYGYGAGGQVPSGISRDTIYLFTHLKDPTYGGTHNSVLQQFVDAGLVGALLLLITVVGAARGVAKLYRSAATSEQSELMRALAALILVLTMSGSTESFLSGSTPSEPFWLFFLLTLILAEYAARPNIEAPVLAKQPEVRRAILPFTSGRQVTRNQSLIPRFHA